MAFSWYNSFMSLTLPSPDYAGAVDPDHFARFCGLYEARPRRAIPEMEAYDRMLVQEADLLLEPVRSNLSGTTTFAVGGFRVVTYEPTLPDQSFGGSYTGEWHVDGVPDDGAIETLIADIQTTEALSGELDLDKLGWSGNQVDDALAEVLAGHDDQTLVDGYGLTIHDGMPTHTALVSAESLVHRSPANKTGQLVTRNLLVAKFIPVDN